jgi:hypothetical protein
MITLLWESRNPDTHQIIGRSNWSGHRLSKPRGGPIPNSSRGSARLRDHLTREVERFALSKRPRAAGWARQAAQLFNGQVVLGRLDGLTGGIVAGRENPSPSQGDLVVGPLLGDVRSTAEHKMKVIAHHGIATNLDGEEPC